MKFKQTISEGLPYFFSLFVAFVATRLFEYSLEPNTYFGTDVSVVHHLKGLLFDFQLALLVSTAGFILALLFNSFLKRGKWIPFHLLNLLSILANFALVVYLLRTKQALSTEFFQLSASDISTAADLRTNADVTSVTAIFGLIIIYFLLARSVKKRTARSKRLPAFYVLFAILAGVLIPWNVLSTEDHVGDLVSNNKLSIFLNAANQHYFGAQEPEERLAISAKEFRKLDGTFFQDSTQRGKRFPMLHSLPNESTLSTYMKAEKEPPNVVIIIVESLSSSFVGKNADRTGHLMPFLDSLAGKSLFFPNFLSTCERTHNVLPAVLTSIPNPPNGIMLQTDNFPRHWSLMALLKSHYYSRFYCGVDLEYSNMKGYMNYLQTDYQVNQWNKGFSTTINGVENPWGHSDDQLFEQSWTDLPKQQIGKRSRLDVFLTISTHTPFMIPNKEKYISLLKDRFKPNKRYSKEQRNVLERKEDFAAYVFTDEALRKYFTKAQQNPEFDNTIYLILGDHGSELTVTSEIEKYKTPLILYSPLLKKAKTFEAVCSHSDITPTLVNYLRLTYPELNLPAETPFYGQELAFHESFESKRTLPLITIDMQNKHLVMGNYFLYDKQLFRIHKNLRTTKVKDEQRSKRMSHQLKLFGRLAKYLYDYDRILSEELYASYVRSEEYETLTALKQKSFPNNIVSDEYIHLGKTVTLDPKTKSIQVEFEGDFYLKTLKELDALPKLTVSLDNISATTKENVFWKQTKPVLMNQFKAHSWNTVKFTMTIRMSDYKKVMRKNNLIYCLYNVKKESWKAQKFNTVVKASFARS